MQLVCPACAARYLVSPAALGEEGKDVRCAKCGHQWFETPEGALANDIVDNYGDNSVDNAGDKFEDNAGGDSAKADAFGRDDIDNDLDDDLDGVAPESEESELLMGGDSDINTHEDIPEGVKPKEGSTNVPAFAEDVIRPQVGRLAKMIGFFTAFGLFLMVLAGGFIFKKQIVSAWVPAAAIYNALGMNVDFQGKELVIENVSAKSQRDVDGKNFLLIQGRVVNLTNDVQPVPKLYARLRSTNGVNVDGWEIDAPLTSLEPGESFIFQSDFPALPDGVGSVNLSFIPAVK